MALPLQTDAAPALDGPPRLRLRRRRFERAIETLTGASSRSTAGARNLHAQRDK
nr:unnamed protein product [Digitaria exilis]